MATRDHCSFTITLLALLTAILFFIFPTKAQLESPIARTKSSSLLNAINSEGPYLGLITVYPPEENAFFAYGTFKNHSKYPYVDLSGRRFRVGTIEGKKVIYVRSGVGMVNAASTTQQMVDLFNIKGVIHFGISGNTNSSLSIGDVLIPSEFADTGFWDWLKPDGMVPSVDVAKLDVGNYNAPKGGSNLLGRIGYSPEQFYSEADEVNVPRWKFWFPVTRSWLQLAVGLKGLELKRCVNSSLCLMKMPEVVIGPKASTSSAFIDNAVYREFLFHTFGVSSADMESAAVVMTCSSNGFPVIVIRGLSDLAGAEEGQNSINDFESLAASNVAKTVIKFIGLIPKGLHF